MKEKGFTLVEIIIAIAIIGILLAIATLDFRNYIWRQNNQAQVKEMFTDLLGAKVDAMHRNMQYTVQIRVDTNSYTITDGNGNVTQQKNLRYPIITNAGAGNNLTLTFNNKGFNTTGLNTPLDPLDDPPQAVCISAENSLGYDSIVIDQVKINLAKNSNSGVDCASANCNIQ